MRALLLCGLMLVPACGDGTEPADNQAPVVISAIEDTDIRQGEMREWMLEDHFSDPDGDPLTYEAMSSDSESLGANIVEVSKLAVEGHSAATATVTVTASDPFDAKAVLPFQVTVVEPVASFRDDFDLNDGTWIGLISVARSPIMRISGGTMTVQVTEEEGHHYGMREIETLGPDWTVRARLSSDGGACGAVMAFPDLPRIGQAPPELAVKMQQDPDGRWYAGIWVAQLGQWVGLGEGPITNNQEFNELGVGLSDNMIHGSIGEETVFDVPMPSLPVEVPPTIKGIGAGGYPCTGPGTVRVDWIEAAIRQTP